MDTVFACGAGIDSMKNYDVCHVDKAHEVINKNMYQNKPSNMQRKK
jgi:hypothetical protein